jgi:3-oxoacyl-[acyl-carrier-protein] synthase II
MNPRDVLITGIGLVSSLGEGVEAHWAALTRAKPLPVTDSARFAPYTVHPLPEIDWAAQIPARGDRRQMELWQRLGTYTAGLALDDSGMKGDETLCATMDMTIAAGGGERDVAVDAAILTASATRNDRGVLLNEKLTTELRPTLFLAQLSNLLAGNISIVHKVTGSSRTFMGEEGSGISALDTAARRIRAGQSSHALVGAAFESEHPDMLLGYELGGYLHRGEWRPVWERSGSEGGGVVSGSGAAFLVLESREHAEKRGRVPYSELGPIVSGRAKRQSENLAQTLSEMLVKAELPEGKRLVVSGSSGAHDATGAETKALADEAFVLRGFSTMTGHLKEAQFPFAVALAALAAHRGAAYPAFSAAEKAFHGETGAVLATAIGYHQFEGMAAVYAA